MLPASYARTDELGVPFAITVDHATLDDGTATLRERDSTAQVGSRHADACPVHTLHLSASDNIVLLSCACEPLLCAGTHVFMAFLTTLAHQNAGGPAGCNDALQLITCS